MFDHDEVVRMFTAGIAGLEDRIRMLEDSRLPPVRPARPAARARR